MVLGGFLLSWFQHRVEDMVSIHTSVHFPDLSVKSVLSLLVATPVVEHTELPGNLEFT